MEEGIILYGACDDDGESWLYWDEPTREEYVWIGNGMKSMKLPIDNLFPKDEPIRLELRRIND